MCSMSRFFKYQNVVTRYIFIINRNKNREIISLIMFSLKLSFPSNLRSSACRASAYYIVYNQIEVTYNTSTRDSFGLISPI